MTADTITGMRMLMLVCVLGLSACTSGPQPMDDTAYDRDILAGRAAKDSMFKTHSESPLLPEDRAIFERLLYYPVNSLYRMPARLDEDRSNTAVIELSTSSTDIRRMQRVGLLRFTFSGQPQALTAFADEGTVTITRLFVPFRDSTSKDATYAGGRYLDLTRTSTGLYDLDFNHAYNPYCVYNIAYSCPVPPQENTLPLAIFAGEKLPAGYKEQ